MSQLRRNLAYLIAKHGINPTALAKATGVQQPTIHRILKGESDDPRTATVQPLADYFGVSVEFMRTADAQAFDHGKPPEPPEVEAAPSLRRFKNVPKIMRFRIDLFNTVPHNAFKYSTNERTER